MPEQDHNAGESEEAEVVFRLVLIANDQPAKVVEPGKETFYFPPARKASECTPILLLPIRAPVLLVWSDHFGTKLLEHLGVKRVAVVGFVTNQSRRRIGNETPFNRSGHQLHFSRASTFCAYGDRKTMAVCNGHDLGALAAFGLSDAEPPFFAGTNVPSMKHSRRSNPPRSLRSWATAKSTCSSIPERTQFWNRRCEVWYEPYRGGKSFQGAPVRNIHRMPLNTVRRSVQGRPRRSARTRSGGKMVSTIFHCSSVRSISPHSTLSLKVQELIYEMASSYADQLLSNTEIVSRGPERHSDLGKAET